MTKSEIKDYLKNNMKIYVDNESYGYNGIKSTIFIFIEDEIISKDSFISKHTEI